jgi:hypothetical protein
LSRFQRDGYSMLIPRCMRKAFQIHLKSIMNNGIKGQSVETSVANQTSKLTCHLTKSRPVVLLKKPNQLAGAAIITALRVKNKYQMAEDIGNEVQGEDMSGDSFTDYFLADDEKEKELNAIDNRLWLSPAARPQIAKRVTETRRTTSDMIIDGILNRCKREDEGRRSANQSIADGSPATRLPPDLEELARLVAAGCMDANSNEICQETLGLRVLSSECQMLKDRWNGMARLLSRFQRDGYSMLIPRCMRKAFQIHLTSIMNNGIKGHSIDTSAVKQKATPPVVMSHPQKKPNQLAGAATVIASSVKSKRQAAEDLGNEVQGEDTNGDSFTYNFTADDAKVLKQLRLLPGNVTVMHFLRGIVVKKSLPRSDSRQLLRRFHRNTTDLFLASQNDFQILLSLKVAETAGIIW